LLVQLPPQLFNNATDQYLEQYFMAEESQSPLSLSHLGLQLRFTY